MNVDDAVEFFASHPSIHHPLALLVPDQAFLQWCAQPPADPFHRPVQRQALGERQPPGPTRMGGIDQHRTACRHAGCNGGVQLLLHLRPMALNLRVAIELLADPVGGDQLRLQQRRQQRRDRALAAGRRTDQQMAAQAGSHGTPVDERIMGMVEHVAACKVRRVSRY